MGRGPGPRSLGVPGAWVVDHGVVVGVRASHGRLLIPPGLPVGLGVVITRGVPLGIRSRSFLDERRGVVTRRASPVTAS